MVTIYHEWQVREHARRVGVSYMKKEMIASTSSCGSLAIGDDCGNLVAGDSRRVDVSRRHDGELVICDGREAGVAGTPSAKWCLISASLLCRISLMSDLTAVVVSARCNGVEEWRRCYR